MKIEEIRTADNPQNQDKSFQNKNTDSIKKADFSENNNNYTASGSVYKVDDNKKSYHAKKIQYYAEAKTDGSTHSAMRLKIFQVSAQGESALNLEQLKHYSISNESIHTPAQPEVTLVENNNNNLKLEDGNTTSTEQFRNKYLKQEEPRKKYILHTNSDSMSDLTGSYTPLSQSKEILDIYSQSLNNVHNKKERSENLNDFETLQNLSPSMISATGAGYSVAKINSARSPTLEMHNSPLRIKPAAPPASPKLPETEKINSKVANNKPNVSLPKIIANNQYVNSKTCSFGSFKNGNSGRRFPSLSQKGKYIDIHDNIS